MAEKDLLILADIILDKVEHSPDLDVLTFVNVEQNGDLTEEIRTYRQLWQNGCRVAAGLAEEGMKNGDTFGLLMQNHPEFVDAMVGSSIEGTVFVPIDPRTRGDKLVYMLSFAECRGVVVADYALPQLAEVMCQLPLLEWIWVVDSGSCHERPRNHRRVREMVEILRVPFVGRAVCVTDANAPMQYLYTSGTTGDPKAILGSYARFGTIAALGPVVGLEPEDRPYTGLSLTHANAQLITLGNILAQGLRGVISRKFTKSRLWDITRKYGCTTFNLLGGMTTAIFADPVRPSDADNPVRYVFSAGMPEAIWEDFSKRFNVDIYEFYGAAEGGLTLNPPGRGPVGSIGKAPSSMTCTIRDEEDKECPRGQTGEICFRNSDGSVPLVNYHKNPEASAKKTRGGWLRMGDVGRMDEEGFVYFHYREGGGIRRNGDFVNPAFVEKAIAENDSVLDVFVYGAPMKNGAPGEKEVVAAVVPVDVSSFDPAAIFVDCRGKLESNFVPGFVQVVDEIPKTSSEKPQERFLLEGFDPEAANIYAEANFR
ncbi:AMP-binding protein [Pseudomonas sp. MPC6]|uniref:AMP-binding protein n=1 Tax=unclassified Pseudomonas TaxID=196821 RepID=UPI001110EE70|nr:AMP-binding protein [Pseudomonas sp. MPC6]QCY09451.1 ATP-dependent acyl-CoA ligase [Pseudomonas sp. MPC6]